MTQQNDTFWGMGPEGEAYDPQIRTRARFCTMQLANKFHLPAFNRSEVMILTNKLTNNMTPLKTSTSLSYVKLVDKNETKCHIIKYCMFLLLINKMCLESAYAVFPCLY